MYVLQRQGREAEQRYMHHHKALTEFEGTHQPKEAEIQRLRQELENHARCAASNFVHALNACA